MPKRSVKKFKPFTQLHISPLQDSTSVILVSSHPPPPAQFATTNSYFGLVMVKIAGGGNYMLYLAQSNPEAVVNWLKIQTGDEIIYMTAVTLPRIAKCILYFRVFTQKADRIFTWITLIICILHWLGSGILAEFVICHPYTYKWDSSIKGGWCSDMISGYKFVNVPNLVINVALVVLPLSSLYRLQMSQPRRIGIYITLFIAGCLYVLPP